MMIYHMDLLNFFKQDCMAHDACYNCGSMNVDFNCDSIFYENCERLCSDH